MDRVAALAASAPEVETLSQWESASSESLATKSPLGPIYCVSKCCSSIKSQAAACEGSAGRAPGAVQSSILDAGCPTSAPCPRRVS